MNPVELLLEKLRALFAHEREVIEAQEQAASGQRSGAPLTAAELQRLANLARGVTNVCSQFSVDDLKDALARTLDSLDELIRTARDGNRSLTDDEEKRHKEHKWIFDAIAADLRASNSYGPRQTVVPQINLGPGSGRRLAPGEVAVLDRSERLADLYRDDQLFGRDGELSFARWLRGVATGQWSSAELEAMRAYGTAPDSSGGYLVPMPLSAELIDLARNKTRVIQAGARTVPMSSNTLDIARVAGDPTAAWKLENDEGSFSEGSFERITLKAKVLIAMLKTSIEAIEDATMLEGQIEGAMADVLALELDRAALRGSGVDPEPWGVRNQTINLQVHNAIIANYDPFSTAVQTIWNANGEPNGIIFSPRTAGTIDRLKDTTNQPLQPPESYRNLPKYVTKQIPENLGDGANDSEAYVADWTKLLIGMRTDLRIEATRTGGSDGTGSAFKNLQLYIRAYLRADVALAQPTHFVAITEIEPV